MGRGSHAGLIKGSESDGRGGQEDHVAVIVFGFLGSLLTVFALCRLVTCRLAKGSVSPDDWSARKREQRRLMDEVNSAAWHRNRDMVMR